MFRWLYALLLALLLALPVLAGPPPATAGNAVFAPLDRDEDERRDDRDGDRSYDEDGDDEDRDGDRSHDGDDSREDDEGEHDEDRDGGRSQDEDDSRGNDEDEDNEDRDGNRSHDEDDSREDEDGKETYDDDYAYYGRVQATAPEVVVGSRVLAGDLALLEFLAPGMRVEVEGRVKGGHIRVKALHVHHPKNWAFYEGPTPEGWARVWYAGGRPWRVQAAEPGPRVRLLACFEEDWQGLPEALHPALHPPRSGLWLLEGLLWQGQVRWTRQTRLGACDE